MDIKQCDHEPLSTEAELPLTGSGSLPACSDLLSTLDVEFSTIKKLKNEELLLLTTLQDTW